MADLKFGSTKDGYLIWHKGNDGEDSLLDADALDGLEEVSFIRSDENREVSLGTRLSVLGSIDLSGGNLLLGSYEFTIFRSIWKTDADEEVGIFTNSNQIKLPLSPAGTYDFTVYWGDGESNYITSWDQAETTHSYVDPGVYIVNIEGIVSGFGFSENNSDAAKLFDIIDWGEDVRIHGDGFQFYNCVNLVSFSSIKESNMFDVTNAESMFENCYRYNQNISLLNGNLFNTSKMLKNCFVFNSEVNIESGSITNTSEMFYNCYNYNKPITFSLSESLNCSYMFNQCYSLDRQIIFTFNQNANLLQIFDGCSFSAENFSYILNNISGSSSLPLNQNVGYIVSEFLSTPESILSFNQLQDTYNWTISSLGEKADVGSFLIDDLVMIILGGSFVLPTKFGGVYNFTVDWGDNSSDVITEWDQLETTHEYASFGKYVIKISGTFDGFSFLNNSLESPKLIDVVNFGEARAVGSGEGLFLNCYNLRGFSAPEFLNLTSVNNTSYNKMFMGCNYIDFSNSIQFLSVPQSADDMFKDCRRMKSVNIHLEGYSEFIPLVGFTYTEGSSSTISTFENAYCFDIKDGYLIDVTDSVDASSMFKNCHNLKIVSEVDLEFKLYMYFNKVNNASSMFERCYNIDPSQYSKFLNELLDQTTYFDPIPISNIQFTNTESFYLFGAVEARNTLVNNFNWTITDKGLFGFVPTEEALQIIGEILDSITGEAVPVTGYIYIDDDTLLNDVDNLLDEINGE